jgi:arsenate reductase
MDEWTIWHNPSCSKSRRALELLRDRAIEPRIVLYLDTPPSRAELERALAALGIEPRDLMRKGEAIYTELRLGDQGRARDELIAAMVAHPMLIERPIVLRGDRAVLGRPPERVADLF